MSLLITLIVEAANISKKFHQDTQRNNPEDNHINHPDDRKASTYETSLNLYQIARRSTPEDRRLHIRKPKLLQS